MVWHVQRLEIDELKKHCVGQQRRTGKEEDLGLHGVEGTDMKDFNQPDKCDMG